MPQKKHYTSRTTRSQFPRRRGVMQLRLKHPYLPRLCFLSHSVSLSPPPPPLSPSRKLLLPQHKCNHTTRAVAATAHRPLESHDGNAIGSGTNQQHTHAQCAPPKRPNNNSSAAERMACAQGMQADTRPVLAASGRIEFSFVEAVAR